MDCCCSIISLRDCEKTSTDIKARDTKINATGKDLSFH